MLLSATVSSMEACGRVLTARAAGAGDALSSVDSLRTVLRDNAGLAIPVVALCSKVTTFGIYDELPPGALLPRRPNRAIVYCEIKNFKPDQDESGHYHTRLSNRLELFTSDGRSLWVQEESKIEDVSKQQREDFFLAQLVTFPASVEPGEHILKVSVTDELGGSTNEAIHRFHIGSAEQS
jgi:hypothetical protein